MAKRARSLLILLLAAAGLLAPPGTAGSATPRVLATGDSMLQPLDEQLTRRIERGGGRVRSDPRPGSGITKPLVLDWPRHARRQVRRHRPRATVMFLGANDANPLRGESGPAVDCCRRAWIDEYAERVGRMMRTYRRGGAAYVYWLTLPTPRSDTQARRIAAVNLAVAQAGAGAPEGVRVVDTVPVLSPGNRYRRSVRYRGRMRVVRARDGVHLTTAGARIARDLVVRAMRADGLL